MAKCCAHLSSSERRILRTLLAQESEIAVHCNRFITQFSTMLNELQLIHHESDAEKRANKCDEFVRLQTTRFEHTMSLCESNYEMVPGAIQLAMSSTCICIQAACFRMVYKWIPKLDVLRMKLLKIKAMCEKPGSKRGIELCADIEKTVENVLKSQAASHYATQ
jgi:hypothetical protein